VKIIWPIDPRDALNQWISFQIKVLKELQISFNGYPSDPIELARRFVSGHANADEYDLAAKFWWKLIDEPSKIRNFVDEEPLMARLAICLLNNSKPNSDFSENVAWFFEVLNMLKKDIEIAREIMHEHFHVAPCAQQ
jgi:hypothetical protein